MNTKVNEGKLISGKEALIALANGVEVECKNDVTGMDWCDATGLLVKSFFDPTHMWGFRLKPRTITINGIEVPAPFEPKSGDMVWCLNELSEKGCEARSAYDSDDFTAHIAYWRTEEEIKKVVVALRQVFGGSHEH